MTGAPVDDFEFFLPHMAHAILVLVLIYHDSLK